MNETALITFEETEKVAKALQGSRYFNDVNNIEQAITKILAGREMGFGPFASMRGVYIIQGAPALSANLMASAVKRSGRYNYRVREMTDQVCKVEFFEGGQSIGVSEFTIENARKAGTKNLDKFPRNMLFARAMSNGVRWFCPDVMGGASVYTPEELGAAVNEDGDIIDAGEWHAEEQPAEVKTQAPAQVVNIEQPKTVIERMDEKKSGVMTIEQAEAEISPTNHCTYGEIETSKLAMMFGAMKKQVSPTADQVRKIKAVEVILAARKAGRAVAKLSQEVTPAEVDAWAAAQ